MPRTDIDPHQLRTCVGVFVFWFLIPAAAATAIVYLAWRIIGLIVSP